MRNKALALGLLALAVITFFIIPGVGIILALMAGGVALTAHRNGWTILGILIAFAGIAAIPLINPILGTVVLLIGAFIAAAWAPLRRFL